MKNYQHITCRTSKISIIILILVYVLWFPLINATAQNIIQFEHLSIEQGLSQSTVTSIVEDHLGFIWFGTEEGLNRYDGYGFTVYKPKFQNRDSLLGKNITSLLHDSTKTLWVGTRNGGVSKYDYKTDTFTTFYKESNNPKTINSSSVFQVYEDKTGTIWVVTRDAGLNKYDRSSETFSALRHDPNNPNSISSDNLRVICEDQKGTIWIGTKDEGLTLYDRKTQTFTRLRHNPNDPSTVSSNFIREIYQDSQGILWVGTDNGLNKYNYETSSFTVFRNVPNVPNSISNNDIRVIYEDRSNTLWVGTRNGLNRYNRDSSTFTVFQLNNSDSSSIRGDVIFSIYEDHTGILWVGTNGGGINKYDPRVQRFTTIKSSPVYSIYQDSQGSIWVGTDGRGLNKYNSQGELLATFRHDPKNANSISSDVVHSVYEDPSGVFWIATLDGLNRYDPKKQTFTIFRHDPKDSNTISNNIVQIICSDSDKILWIGTERGGLNKYDSRKQTFKAFRKSSNLDPNGLKGDNVRAIAIDDNNKMIWIGTDEGGLSRFDPKTETFTTFRHDPNNPNSISSNFVFSICIDSKGILWIGTNTGLSRFNAKTETFKNFAELNNETIYGVLDDGQGELWLSSNRGIYRFNTETETLKNYDVSDGLQSNEFNGFAYYKSSQGEMFFGGINGFNRFFPEKIKDNKFVPSIVITKFKIFDRVTNRFLSASGLGEAETLTLSYKENFFSFEFAALNFTNSQKNQYMYKLEGIDSDWVNNGTQRYAQYTSLPPGEYIFRVKGSNNDGLWNEQGIALRIKITPPIWRTWWAYSLYFLTFVGLSYRAYRYRLETLERRLQLERAEEVGKKNQELEAKNQELAAQKEKLVEKNKELIESHQRADRIFSALAEALPGTVLDSKYRLEEKIGTGGFGAVFSATHLSMKRQVAVKVFKPVPGNDSADALNRFQMEAVSASRINSPNAVAILDSGISTEGIAYLVMELLQGHTLNRELQLRKRLSLKRAAQILLPICGVLSKAHSLGIVHRDIKPDNIFLHRDSEGEVVKLVDFGIAKLTENIDISNFQNLTATGVIIGTPAYMAPERFESGVYDTSSDVYSLGLVLYEMLAGCSPFQSSSKDIFGLLHSRLSFPAKPIKEFNAEISAEVEAVVMRAIAKNPSERPSVEDLAESFLQATGLNIEQVKSDESQAVVTGDLHYSSSPNSTTMTDLQLVVRKMEYLQQALSLLLKSNSKDYKTLLNQIALTNKVDQTNLETFVMDENYNPVSAERWKKIEELFFAVVELDTDKQSAFLDEACQSDPSLRLKVEALLKAKF